MTQIDPSMNQSSAIAPDHTLEYKSGPSREESWFGAHAEIC